MKKQRTVLIAPSEKKYTYYLKGVPVLETGIKPP